MAHLLTLFKRHVGATLATLALVAAAVTAAATYTLWLPHFRHLMETANASAADGHEDAGHGHGPAASTDDSSIELSRTGLKNVDFEPITVSLSTFERTLTLPAIVAERPGRSQIHITAPLTGVITEIYPIEGAAVEPNSLMFEIRLTHEELVVAQRDFLRTAENLEVVNREIARLKSVGDGIIAGKRILEQQYEQRKIQGSLLAERQALLLHGLQDDQIDEILQSRQLLPSLSVRAPDHTHQDDGCLEDHLFHVQQLPVKLGEHVEIGQLLCVLADHCELFVEGRAFEDDARRLREVAREGWDITANVVTARRQVDKIEGLRLLYLSDRVDSETRALRFYVRLPNKVVLDQKTETGRRFIAWRFNPGQRMELQVPVEKWENRIVLPVEAIVEDGAETYAYARSGDHFNRVPVHVEYRDQSSAVVANDGSLLPGDVVAARGAYQMHLALKNKAGGGVDAHAGHAH